MTALSLHVPGSLSSSVPYFLLVHQFETLSSSTLFRSFVSRSYVKRAFSLTPA